MHPPRVTGYPHQQILDRFPPEQHHRFNPCQDYSQINTSVQVPIEICLARSNREALAGVAVNHNCTAFNVTADLCGVLIMLVVGGSATLTHEDSFGSLSRCQLLLTGKAEALFTNIANGESGFFFHGAQPERCEKLLKS